MRLELALGSLALFALPTLVQEPAGSGPDDDEPSVGLGNTFASVFESEQERLAEAIEGTWILQEYNPSDAIFDPNNVRGTAMFRDGFLSVNIMAQTFVPEFLGDGGQLWVQAGTHRYRINEFLELQTSTVIGFDNYEDVNTIMVESSGNAREYQLLIDDEGATLRMTSGAGAELVWSRLQETEFPQISIDILDANRGGR